MPLLALVDDLLFRSRLDASARHLGIAPRLIRDSEALQCALAEQPWSLLLVDLNLASGCALESIRIARTHTPQLPIIGFCAHVQTELPAQAVAAGCTEVLSHGQLIQRLPDLLAA